MPRFGVSLYPEHSTVEKDHAYLELAGRYGFKRVFSCMISATGSREQVVGEYRALVDCAHDNGMEVCLDVSPAVFSRLGIDPSDLSFFSDVHTDAIRLDEAFDAARVAAMTRNRLGIAIELNASTVDGTLAAVMCHDARLDQLIACHNFYPQRYTGLSFEHFVRTSRDVRAAGLRLAAFVSSGVAGAFGPWPASDGMPTLESHRDLAIDLQARHLLACGLVDDILVSNCFASEAELASLAAIDPACVTMRVVFEGTPGDVERAIVLDFPHMVRGDVSDFMRRSTMCRIAYADATVPARNVRDLLPGDIVVGNDSAGRYKAELQVVLKPMPNDGTKNVVAHLAPSEQMLLAYLEPWRSFKLIE